MAFRLKIDESVPKSIRRIVAEQIDAAIDEVDDPDLDSHQTIHQVRKRCKKIRGVLRLVRPPMEDTYQRENAWFRDAARDLSALRDREAMIETYDLLLDSYAEQVARKDFAPIRRKLVRRRQQASDEGELQQRLAGFRARMVTARERLKTWPVPKGGFKAVCPGLLKTYRRGRKAMEKVYLDPTTPGFHDWRKRAKYHRYHARLLRDLWPELMNPWRDSFEALSDLLGNDHDLAVLREELLAGSGAFGDRDRVQALVGLLDRHRGRLQEQARWLGERCYAEPPKRFRARLKTYWQAWQAEATAAEAVAEPALAPGA